jgi:tripartite-type tricarboxylate transporter receptor subunit TctC
MAAPSSSLATMAASRRCSRHFPALAAAVAIFAAPLAALAADPAYPDRVVKLVAAQEPGSATDKVARTVAAALEKHWGKPVIVENRPGAGGTIGADLVAKAMPDGYTLLLGGYSNMIVAPAMRDDIRYDVTRDFLPFGRVAVVPFVYAVHPSVPAQTLPELVALARAEPGKLNVASLGGGVTAMGLATFFAATGVTMTAIEYKGSVGGITDLVAGRIDFMFNEIAGLQSQAKAGRVRLLAVATPRRIAAAPELPTTGEQGLPSIVVAAWYGVFAPAGTPAAIVSRLEDAMAAARRSPELQEHMRALGYEVVAEDDAASFARQIDADAREARRLLKPPAKN